MERIELRKMKKKNRQHLPDRELRSKGEVQGKLRNNLDIPYVTIEIKNVQELVETIALLNASSKAWTLQDYIQSWKIVNKDYQTLQELFQRYDIELSQLASILNKGYCLPKNSHFSTKLLKSGNFVINNITAGLIIPILSMESANFVT